MLISTAIDRNTLTYIGQKPVPHWSPPPKGLRSVHNRGHRVSWQWVEAERGVFDWTMADAWVDGNIAQGLEPIALLDNAPAWAFSASGQLDHAAQAAFTRLAVNRYLGRVRVWELGNECDSDGYLNAHNPFEQGRQWRNQEDAIRSVDPWAYVICGSFQSIPEGGMAPRYIAEALRGYGGVPQALSVHAYPQTDAQVKYVSTWLQHIRGALRASDCAATDLCVTEWGIPRYVDRSAADKLSFSTAMLRAQDSAGVALSLHYMFDDNREFGHVDQVEGAALWNAAVQAATGFDPAQAVKLADEGGQFKLRSRTSVWYGVNNRMVKRVLAPGTHTASNTIFGDPAVGVGKAAYRMPPKS